MSLGIREAMETMSFTSQYAAESGVPNQCFSKRAQKKRAPLWLYRHIVAAGASRFSPYHNFASSQYIHYTTYKKMNDIRVAIIGEDCS